VRVVTNLSGQVVAEYSYDAFGNQLEGEDGWNPFKYCGIFGYREDEEINLMKVGARFYDPTIGRWIQKDPILSGVNWWLYCENDPVNGVDPEGKILSTIECGILVCIGGFLLGGPAGLVIAAVGFTIIFYEVYLPTRDFIEAREKREEWRGTPAYDWGIPPYQSNLWPDQPPFRQGGSGKN